MDHNNRTGAGDDQREISRAAVEQSLVNAREQFLAFVRSRVADPGLAEDILQDALLRAFRSVDRVREEERVVPWFYSILRNGIIDAYRRRDVQRRHLTGLPEELGLPDLPSDEVQLALCECFRGLITTLKPEYASILESDLAGEPRDVQLQRLGITPANLKVRRHRARGALRHRLEETCRVCSEHGCLDCTCEDGRAKTAEVRSQV